MDNEQQAVNALKEIAMAGVTEQRKTRRWNTFFKCVYLLMGVAALVIMGTLAANVVKLSNPGLLAMGEGKKYAAMVSVSGTIADDQPASARNVISSLRKAFEDKKAEGVLIRCNSPGGSPVQSSYIYNEIMRLRKKHDDKKVYAVAEDMCASGGYYIIAAAEKIYADKSSLIGSIGVRMDSFGVVEAMKKVGVESRQITAGENKSLLNPFEPQKAEEVAFIEKMLANVHKHFIDAVKQGRGERLDAGKSNELFSGLIWDGEAAKELGLIDGYASVSSLARDELDAEIVVDFTRKQNLLEQLSGSVSAGVEAVLTGKLVGELR